MRVPRTHRSVILALGLATVTLVWMLSGTLVGTARMPPQAPDATHAEASQQRMRVLVTASEAAPVEREVRVQGHLEPWRRVRLRAETEGRVVQLAAEKGALVETDAVLVALAEDDRPAQLARAEADLAARQLELSASERLGSQGMQARTQIKQTQAALAAAEAEIARLQLDIERLRIRAPFAGVIETREVELGSLLQRGDELLELVDTSRLKAVGQVPQQSAGALQHGQRVIVTLLDGTQTEGHLGFISQVADAQTRSFRVEAEIPNPERRLASGVSAELRIQVGEERGHFISPAVLILDDSGRLGVRAVDADDQVHFHPIALIRTEMDGVWVSGLPPQARIITQGQGFVTEGEAVEPMVATPYDS